MRAHVLTLIFAVAISLGSGAFADTRSLSNGSDMFISGAVVTQPVAGPGDTFVAARSTDLSGMSAADLHVAGYDLDVAASTSEDLYAFGATVDINAAVGQDMTAVGFSLRTRPDATTGGNARLFGNVIRIEGAVGGALTAVGRDVVLDAPVAGDAHITARSLTFGPSASVAGTLTYASRNATAVPARVAPPDRVTFEAMTRGQAQQVWHGVRDGLPLWPTFASVLVGFVITLLFFAVLGALALGLVPTRVENMRQSIAARPGQTIVLGVVGLSMLFGAVPIIALTVIGLPFVPIALLVIIVAWTLGYALGAYSVAQQIWTGLGGDPEPGNGVRLMVFGAAIVVIALLNFIPFVGWVANYTLVLLGIGAMTNALFQYLIGTPGPVLDVDMTPLDN